ncbi:hypothetical protein Poly59_08110 [Rubripirellula reticaptiva]|uniref:Uncharacterized protein n=1 Tax=Rubripirellula reticaptiva TaxID=2528013 RepID=A0A5C6FAW2_9BACT|nr:hypothetical protein Poly59_08110 [Rubripirellula reticaptiva]
MIGGGNGNRNDQQKRGFQLYRVGAVFQLFQAIGNAENVFSLAEDDVDGDTFLA